MRSLPVILLAALTAVVIAVSAFLTASHFGMRDWPTPPMPDTATRLITPTEAAGRAGDRADGDGPGAEITADAGASTDARRVERSARGGASRGSADTRQRARRQGTTSRRSRGERRSGTRNEQRGDEGGTTDNEAATEAPAPQTTEAAPVPPAPTGTTGGESQARPEETSLPATRPPVRHEPIYSNESDDDDDEPDDDDDDEHDDDDSGDDD
jgi:hypothetical protein